MSANQAETSTFIQGTNHSKKKDSFGEPPHPTSLRSTRSSRSLSGSHMSIPSQCTTLIKSIIIFLVLLFAILIVVIIVVSTRETTSGSQPFCLEENNDEIETHAPFHTRCGHKIGLVKECQNSKEQAWRYFTKNASEWSSVGQVVTSQNNENFTAMVVSPFYSFSSQACFLQISLEFEKQSAAQIFLVSPNANIAYVTMSLDVCRYALIDNRKFLENFNKFRVVILLESPLGKEELYASVTSHSCFKYQTLALEPKIISKSNFSVVPQGNANLCSLEICNREKVEFNWINVIGMGNVNFTSMETHPCISEGVSHQRNDGFSRFLGLNGTYKNTRGYLLSPIIEGGASHLILSFWYITQCQETKLRVFLIPSSRDVVDVLKGIPPVLQIESQASSDQWKQEVIKIPIQPGFMFFQLVIEGIVVKNGSCKSHRCHLSRGSEAKTPEFPLLAIDDIAFETHHNQCGIANEIHASSHARCEHKFNLVKECQDNQEQVWRYFTQNSSEWNSAAQLVSFPYEGNVTAMIISPVYNISAQTCFLQISFEIQTQTPVKVFLVSTNANDTDIKVTSASCHHILIDDTNLLAKLKTFRIVILLESSFEKQDIYASVTSHGCLEYETLALEPKIISKSNFSVVPQGTRSLCSLDIYNRETVECNWINVIGMGNVNFTSMETHPCISGGVSHQRNDGFSWFLGLSGTYKNTRGYLLSPVIQAGTSSHLILSFWYITQCHGTKLRVFLISSSDDAVLVLQGIPPVLEIQGQASSNEWKLNVTEIPISPGYTSFQVVIEGEVIREGSCESYRCSLNGREGTRNPAFSLLAIDDIAFEMRHDQCSVAENSSSINMDCSFQNGTTSTTCDWISTSNYLGNLPASFTPYAFSHWKPQVFGDDLELEHGATSSHLEGRGSILSFDATGRAGSNTNLRSPKLIGNSNCTCVMQFIYLLRGRFAPRLQVNLVFASDEDPDSDRLEPQWSLFGHQSDEWLTSSVPLNLQTAVPFQVEIRVKDIRDARGDVHIDDILFRDCDFRVVES